MYVPLQPNWETEKSDSINTFCTKNNKNYSEKNKQEKKKGQQTLAFLCKSNNIKQFK